MALSVRAITPAQHLEWIQSRPSVSFLQTPAWGDVKRGWQHQSLGWFDGDTLAGAGLVLYRPVPKLPQRSLAYIPEGPDIDWFSDRPLSDWLDPLMRHVKGHGAFQLKMGPHVTTRTWSAATIKQGIADGVTQLGDLTPENIDQRAIGIVAQLTALGWTQQASDGAGFGDVQPRYVYQLPLADRSLDDIFAGFNQLWRRNVRKAEKAGVNVVRGHYEQLAAFHEIYVETAARDGFTPRGLDYFQRMWQVMREEDPSRIALYLAMYQDRVVAATTMVRVGDHAWYSYGASTTADREVRPSNAIQWQMIKDAHAAGCRIYDLRGISSTLNPDDHLFGLIQFKVGTGGQAIEYLGEWDMVLRKSWAKAFAVYMERKG